MKSRAELQEAAMRASGLSKGLVILLDDGSLEGRSAAELILEEVVRLTGQLNTDLDSVNFQ